MLCFHCMVTTVFSCTRLHSFIAPGLFQFEFTLDLRQLVLSLILSQFESTFDLSKFQLTLDLSQFEWMLGLSRIK